MTSPITTFTGKYHFLSNFYKLSVPLMYEGLDYPTLEHAYQAAKCLDEDGRRYIRLAPDPAGAKKRGRKCRLREDWEQVKVAIMRELLRQKFTTDLDLLQRLLATGEAELIEGNWWGDRFWGVCQGKGQNILGQLLMELRKELKDYENSFECDGTNCPDRAHDHLVLL